MNRLGIPPPKTSMTMENPPFKDVFPIENGNFPLPRSFFGSVVIRNSIFLIVDFLSFKLMIGV